MRITEINHKTKGVLKFNNTIGWRIIPDEINEQCFDIEEKEIKTLDFINLHKTLNLIKINKIKLRFQTLIIFERTGINFKTTKIKSKQIISIKIYPK